MKQVNAPTIASAVVGALSFSLSHEKGRPLKGRLYIFIIPLRLRSGCCSAVKKQGKIAVTPHRGLYGWGLYGRLPKEA